MQGVSRPNTCCCEAVRPRCTDVRGCAPGRFFQQLVFGLDYCHQRGELTSMLVLLVPVVVLVSRCTCLMPVYMC